MFRKNKVKENKQNRFYISGLYVLFSFLLFAGLPHFSCAQKITIEGAITDSVKNGIPDAIVTLRSDDTLVTAITNEKGMYSFSSPVVKPNKIYVLYAQCQKPVYGYSGNDECYASTYGLNNTDRIYERNIMLKQNVVYASAPPPTSVVHFGFKDNTILNTQKDSVLKQWVRYLKNNPTTIVEIEGYADKKEGNKSFRLMLSRSRAKECINYLIGNDIQGSRIRLMGNGSDNPVITPAAIGKIKGKDAKMAACLANCRAGLSLKNMFFITPSTVVVRGLVTDINTLQPVPHALVFVSGSEGTNVSSAADSNGVFSVSITNFNPVSYYNAVVDANGYNPSDPADVFQITPASKDMQVYSHHFQIEKNGYERPFVFSPILFDSGAAVLTRSAMDSLNTVKKIMNERPKIVVEFMGDADMHENDYVTLAGARAQACVNYLVTQGIDAARFIAVGRLSQAAIKDEEKTTQSIVLNKEKKRLFNPKRCNASFWIKKWDYEKSAMQQ